VVLDHQTSRRPASLELGHGCHVQSLLSDGLDQWIAEQEPMALQRILGNIGPAAGAKDGLVIASPSTADRNDEPDYFVSTYPNLAFPIADKHHSIPGRETLP
jgi:hypothetical protein